MRALVICDAVGPCQGGRVARRRGCVGLQHVDAIFDTVESCRDCCTKPRSIMIDSDMMMLCFATRLKNAVLVDLCRCACHTRPCDEYRCYSLHTLAMGSRATLVYPMGGAVAAPSAPLASVRSRLRGQNAMLRMSAHHIVAYLQCECRRARPSLVVRLSHAAAVATSRGAVGT